MSQANHDVIGKVGTVVRVLRDIDDGDLAVLVDGKEVSLDEIYVPLNLIMAVASETDGVCHDDEEDLNTFFRVLVHRWAAWKFDLPKNKDEQ